MWVVGDVVEKDIEGDCKGSNVWGWELRDEPDMREA